MAAAAQTAPLAKVRVIAGQEKPYVLTSRLKAILVGEFTYNFDDVSAKSDMEATLKRIGAEEGWTVDVVKNSNEVTAAKLANYQVFFGDYISDWASPNFPAASRIALQEFVETKGNGLFLMHSSGDATSTAWEWFRAYVHPCHYNGEANRNPASTGKAGVFKGYRGNPGAAGHPVLEGIGWNGKDSSIPPSRPIDGKDCCP